MLFLLFLILAYLLGSVSSAVIVCKLMNLPDPRLEGSKNPGATNVLRIGTKYAALAVLLGDGLKGFIPVLIAHLLGLSFFFQGLIALAALMGHIFPVFFNFEGGKGVATFLGALLAMSPLLGLTAIVVWLIVAFTTKYSSLSSLTSAVAVTLLSPWILGHFDAVFPMLLMTLVLFWRHQENIGRLKAGTESKIDLKSKIQK